MSVRRLAEDQFQPRAFVFNEENTVWAEKTINKYPVGRQQSAVIPLLMRVQEQGGWVTRAAIEKIADMLDMPYIRVMEVATFYTQFQLKPVGTHAHVQVCGTTPCMLRGSEALMDVCRKKIHHDPLHTNESGTLSWEEVECQGACVNAPMVTIFKDTYEDLTPQRLEEIIDTFEAGRGDTVKPGPQIDRHLSMPVGGLTTLTGEIKLERSNLDKPAEAPAAAKAAVTPRSNVAKPKTDAPETDPKLKTPVTAPKSAEENVKVAEKEAMGKVKNTPTSLNYANRPEKIDKPEKHDDLKLISDIGSKIEAMLHELGIYTYAQVAGWTGAQREWVVGYLNLKGGIDCDDWVRQAEVLTRSIEADYIRFFSKKPR